MLTSWRNILFLGLLGALCLVPVVLLWPYRHAAFVSDDRWFASAPLLDSAGRWLIAPWPHPFGQARAYRPVIILSYGLTQWWTSTPPLFHLTNFVVHGVNAMLLAGLLWQVSRSRIAALLGGLLFALHPITHENVVWISGRTYPIAATFGLALLWWTAADVGRARRRWWQHGVGACLLIGALLSYEMTITVPLLVALVRLHRPPGDTTSGIARLIDVGRFCAPYLAIVAVYLLFRWTVISPFHGDASVWRHGINPPPDLVNVRIRVLRNATTLIGRLLNADRELLGAWWSLRTITTVAGIALASVALWGVWIGREIRWLALGAIAMAALSYAPAVVGPAYVDRLTYLTAAAIVSALALGVRAALRHAPALGRLAVVCCVLAVSICSVMRYRELAMEWQHAGAISESLLDQLVQLEPAPAPRARLHFADIPDHYGLAYVYVTYFHYSVRQRYAREDLDIVTHQDGEVPALLSRWNGSAPAPDPEGWQDTALFRWDADTERLSLVWRRPPTL